MLVMEKCWFTSRAYLPTAVKPPPLFLDPGQVEMPYEEGPEETEVYPKIGEMIQVRLLHQPTCPPTLCITSSTGGAGSVAAGTGSRLQ